MHYKLELALIDLVERIATNGLVIYKDQNAHTIVKVPPNTRYEDEEPRPPPEAPDRGVESNTVSW